MKRLVRFFPGLFLAVLCHRVSKVKIVQNWCKRYILAKNGQLPCNYDRRIVKGRALPRMQNMKRGQHSMHNNVGEDGQLEICSSRRWPVQQNVECKRKIRSALHDDSVETDSQQVECSRRGQTALHKSVDKDNQHCTNQQIQADSLVQIRLKEDGADVECSRRRRWWRRRQRGSRTPQQGLDPRLDNILHICDSFRSEFSSLNLHHSTT